MFQIEVKTGEAGVVTMRGCSDGTVELCRWTEKKDKNKDTGKITVTPYLEAYAFYADVSQAFNKIARMRIGSTNATSLRELTEAIRDIRKDIKKELGSIIEP